MVKKNKDSFIMPMAIVIAGVLIGAAVLYTSNFQDSSSFLSSVSQDAENENAGTSTAPNNEQENAIAPNAENVKPVTEDDHMRGNPNASITLIEFSDFQCPYCDDFHAEEIKILEEFPNEVKWVYRHFPLSFHDQALPAAIASECIAEIGGNDAFWEFSDTVFKNQDKMNMEFYNEIAESIGLDMSAFNNCLSSERQFENVKDDFEDAVLSGGQGTPYGIVIAENGDILPIYGALPFDQLKSIIEQAIEAK